MNILLVEDDQDSRIQMANFLRELDHSVVECRDGYEALEAFTRDFHMVLSDIKMPRISGIASKNIISAGRAGSSHSPFYRLWRHGISHRSAQGRGL